MAKNKSVFKVEIRKTCLICGEPIKTARFRTYCGERCRNKRNAEKLKKSGYLKDWQRKKHEKKRLSSGKELIACLICGKKFIQVGSHIVQIHGMTCREYRERYGLEVKRGLMPKEYRKLKGNIAIENGTYKNLEVGKKFWLKKGEKIPYTRSDITIERLKTLHKFTKRFKQYETRKHPK